jgi:hypothetical protein
MSCSIRSPMAAECNADAARSSIYRVADGTARQEIEPDRFQPCSPEVQRFAAPGASSTDASRQSIRLRTRRSAAIVAGCRNGGVTAS